MRRSHDMTPETPIPTRCPPHEATPTTLASTKMHDFIFDHGEDLPSQDYREMLDCCGKIYDLEMHSIELSRRLEKLVPSTQTEVACAAPSPLHLSVQLHNVHLMNHHISKAKHCRSRYRLFLKKIKTIEGISSSDLRYLKVCFEGEDKSVVDFMKAFKEEYEYHENEAFELKKQTDPNILNQFKALNSNIDFLSKVKKY